MPSFYHPVGRKNWSISTAGTLDFDDSDDDDDIQPDVRSEYMLVPSPSTALPSPRTSVIPLIYHLSPAFETWAEHLTPEYEEDDDYLHEPEPDPRMLDASGTIFTRRGVENVGGLILVLLLVFFTMVLPVVSKICSTSFSLSLRVDNGHFPAPGWISGPGIYSNGER